MFLASTDNSANVCMTLEQAFEIGNELVKRGHENVIIVDNGHVICHLN